METKPKPADELLAALERYERDVRQLAAHWRDAELYRVVSRHTEEIRRCCRALPPVSTAWVALLIAHSELLQALWRSADPVSGITNADRERLLATALACGRELQAGGMALARRSPGS